MKLAIRKLAMWIGAVSIAALAPLAQAGLVTDGGFESAGANPPVFANWVDSGGTVRSTTTFHSGFSSAEVQGQNQFQTESLKQQLSGLNSGFTYNLSFWVKCEVQGGGTCNTDIFDVYLDSVLINRDSGGNSILSSLLSVGGSDSGFDHYFGTVTPGIGGAPFLDFQSTEYPNTVFLDDVLFEEAACNPNCNVPEPGSLLLVGAALTAGAIVRRRRQR